MACSTDQVETHLTSFAAEVIAEIEAAYPGSSESAAIRSAVDAALEALSRVGQQDQVALRRYAAYKGMLVAMQLKLEKKDRSPA